MYRLILIVKSLFCPVERQFKEEWGMGTNDQAIMGYWETDASFFIKLVENVSRFATVVLLRTTTTYLTGDKLMYSYISLLRMWGYSFGT
jgi:hypothetical protein